ncbi:MAG TPA: ferredoxin [Pseudonocardiaceae bacterium]
MTTSLHIDWTACRARGVCVDLLPELLEPDPWGYPVPRPDQASEPAVPTVSAELTPHARRAVALCPRMALRLVDDDPPSG